MRIIESVRPQRFGVIHTNQSTVSLMKTVPAICVGIDLSDKTFVASILWTKDGLYQTSQEFDRSESGCTAFRGWLKHHKVRSKGTAIAMETTGNLSQVVCHALVDHFHLSVIDAARIARYRSTAATKTIPPTVD
jgi:hypothetical protein